MVIKDIKNKIAEYFFLNPTIKLRVREIERKTKTALPSVIRYTRELEEEDILKSQNISNVKLYSADRASKKFLLGKKIYNLKRVFNTGLVNYLIKEYDNSPIILFGSYSKGEDIEDSDIDLYIESPSKTKAKIEKYEKELQRDIQIFKYNKFKEIENKELANNIINGTILHGFIEVF
ncbi:MAG: nucleotidyltransferase domain-containing protein [archaeon]